MRLKDFVIVLIAASLAFGGLVYFKQHGIDRIKAFLNPSIDQRGISYQVNQAFIAIGSGGVFGVGYGNSSQKFGFLPEPVGDSIFAVLTEELGLVGAGITLGLFIALAFTLAGIAKNAPDSFGMLLTMGINIWIMVQAAVNVGAVTGIVPLTGVPLPFISFGGTAILSLFAGLGIVFNIAKRS